MDFEFGRGARIAGLTATLLAAPVPALAQSAPNVWNNLQSRSFTQDECMRRASAAAKALNASASGSDSSGVWFTRATFTTIVRCDVPNWVVIITAANSGGPARDENRAVQTAFNAAGTTPQAAPQGIPLGGPTKQR